MGEGWCRHDQLFGLRGAQEPAGEDRPGRRRSRRDPPHPALGAGAAGGDPDRRRAGLGAELLYGPALVPGPRPRGGPGEDRDDPGRPLRAGGRGLPGSRAAQPVRGGPVGRSAAPAGRGAGAVGLPFHSQVPDPGCGRGRRSARRAAGPASRVAVGDRPALPERRPVRRVGPDLRPRLLVLDLHASGRASRAPLADRRGREPRADHGRLPLRDGPATGRAAAVRGRGA